MVLKNSLKLLNKVLLIVLLVFPCLQILSAYFGAFGQLSSQGFVVIIALFAVWAALLKNKELTNLEIAILVLFSFEGILSVMLGVLLTPGFVMESLFGVPLGTYFVVLFLVTLLFWFYRLLRNTKRDGKKKITITKRDILIIASAVLLFLFLIVYCVFADL